MIISDPQRRIKSLLIFQKTLFILLLCKNFSITHKMFLMRWEIHILILKFYIILNTIISINSLDITLHASLMILIIHFCRFEVGIRTSKSINFGYWLFCLLRSLDILYLQICFLIKLIGGHRRLDFCAILLLVGTAVWVFGDALVFERFFFLLHFVWSC